MIMKTLLSLRSVQIEPHGKICPYCNIGSDGRAKPLETSGNTYIMFGVNGWAISTKTNGTIKIRYCPICGRDLLIK